MCKVANRTIQLTTALALVVAGLVLIWGCQPASAQISLEAARQTGLKVGFANFRPYSFVAADGSVNGESVDVVKAILAKLGITKIEPVASEFSALIPSLQAERIDLVASGLRVTPARCKQVLFSKPYLSIREAFVVKKGNPHGASTYEDVAKKGLQLGIIAGGTSLQYAHFAGISDSKISQFPDLPTTLAALRSGRIDVFALTSLAAAGVVQQTIQDGQNDLERAPPIAMVGTHSVVSHNAFGFNLKDKAFVELFNKALDEYIGSPEHLKVISKYGLSKEDLPTMSLAQLCEG